MHFDPTRARPGLSLSRIAQGDCLLRWARLNIERRGKEEPRGRPLILGSVVHGISAEVRKRWMEAGADVRYSGHIDTTAEQVGRQEGADEDTIHEAVEIVNEGFNHLDLFPNRFEVVRWWIEHRFCFDREWHPVEVNEHWQPILSNAVPYFRMIPDFAWLDRDGTLHVEDDKTGWSEPDSIQPRAYGFGIGQCLDKPPERIETRFNVLPQKRHVKAETVYWADVETFPAWVATQETYLLDRTEYPATVGKSCQWCGFKAECPKFEQVGTQLVRLHDGIWPEKIEDPEVANRAAVFLSIAEDIVKQGRDILREYVERTGEPLPIPGDTRQWESREQFRYTADTRKILDSLTMLQIPLETIFRNLSISKRDVESIIKEETPLRGTKDAPLDADAIRENRERRNAWLEWIGDQYETQSKGTRFGLYKREDN